MRNLLSILMLMSATPAVAGDALAIQQGTWEAWGTANVDVATVAGITGFGITIAPGLAYFVSDHVELRMGVGTSIASAAGETITASSVGVGIQYVWSGAGARPYVGTGVAGGDVIDPTVGVSGGVLVPLNKHVAADVGAGVTAMFAPGAVLVDVPAGLLGFRAFF